MTAPPPAPTAPLRPLGLGEILDRAVTLSLRSFPVLALIFLVVAVPRTIVQIISEQTLTPMILAIQADAKSGSSFDKVAADLQQYSASPFLIIGSILLSFLLIPLTVAALTIAANTLMFRGTITFVEAYRQAFGRWGHLLGVNLLWGMTAAGLFFVVYFVLIFATFAIAFLVIASKIAGIVAGVIVGLAVLAIVLGVGVLVTLAWQLSIVACVIEKAGFVDAFVSGFRRVVKGIGWRRSLLAGLTFGLIYLGLGLAATLGAGVLTFGLHQPLLTALFTTVVGLIAQLVATCFMVAFYFDVRVREDGLDLAIAASAREWPAGVA